MLANTWAGLRAQWQKQPASIGFALLIVLSLVGAAGYYFGYRNYVGRRYAQQAEAALAQYDFATARERFADYLTYWPTDAKTHYLLAQTCRRQADFTAADEHLEIARRYGHPEELLALELVLRVAQSEGLPPAGIQALAPFMKQRCPEELLILEALVTGFHNRQRMIETGHWLDYWLKNYPDDWRAYHWRGSYYLEIGHPEESEADFGRCLELNPQHTEAHRGLGIAILKTGTDFAKARDHFQLFVRERPDDADAQVALVRCLRQLNQPVEARAVLTQVLAKHPDKATALLQLGLLASDESELSEALAYLQKADGQTFKDTEDVSTLVSNLTSVSHRMGREAEAKAYQERLTRFNQDLRTLNGAMEKVTQGKPDPDMAYEVGAIYLRIGLHDDGKRWLNSVLQLQPNDRRANQALLEFYSQRSDPESQRRADACRHALESADR